MSRRERRTKSDDKAGNKATDMGPPGHLHVTVRSSCQYTENLQQKPAAQNPNG